MIRAEMFDRLRTIYDGELLVIDSDTSAQAMLHIPAMGVPAIVILLEDCAVQLESSESLEYAARLAELVRQHRATRRLQ